MHAPQPPSIGSPAPPIDNAQAMCKASPRRSSAGALCTSAGYQQSQQLGWSPAAFALATAKRQTITLLNALLLNYPAGPRAALPGSALGRF